MSTFIIAAPKGSDLANEVPKRRIKRRRHKDERGAFVTDFRDVFGAPRHEVRADLDYDEQVYDLQATEPVGHRPYGALYDFDVDVLFEEGHAKRLLDHGRYTAGADPEDREQPPMPWYPDGYQDPHQRIAALMTSGTSACW